MNVSKLMAGVALATASMTATGPVAAPAVAQPADFAARADAILDAAYPADGPGAAVIVTRGGRTLYAGGRGLAELETRRPITPDTLFPLGSIAKQFTAALALKLVAEGRISLDDPLSRFFPGWPEPGASATVRQLLNHSSGIQDVTKVPGWIDENRLRNFTTDDLVAQIRDLPARAEPGHAWEYNNSAYMLVGAIIEQVTGQTWHEAMTERIIKPFGLSEIGFVSEPGPATTSSYRKTEGRLQPVDFPPTSILHAGGGLTGSVGDMARWAHALHNGRVVSPDLYQEMIRPARLAGGSSRPYGFGLRLQKLRERPAFVHGGAGRGIDTDSVYIPSEDLFVAVFANSDDPVTDPDTLTFRLAALALGEPIPTFSRADVDMSTIEPLFGSYSSEQGPPFRFFARDGRLYMGRGDSQREAFAAGENRFFFGPDELMWFRIVPQADGRHVMELNAPDLAAPERAILTSAVPPPFTVAPDVLRIYAGAYQTETVALTVILGENGSLTITPAGQDPLPMRPVSETEFRIDGTPMRVVFHPENGKVDRLTVYRGARELHGQRTGR